MLPDIAEETPRLGAQDQPNNRRRACKFTVYGCVPRWEVIRVPAGDARVGARRA